MHSKFLSSAISSIVHICVQLGLRPYRLAGVTIRGCTGHSATMKPVCTHGTKSTIPATRAHVTTSDMTTTSGITQSKNPSLRALSLFELNSCILIVVDLLRSQFILNLVGHYKKCNCFRLPDVS
jgi:hypothetical protein